MVVDCFSELEEDSKVMLCIPGAITRVLPVHDEFYEFCKT